MFMTYTIKVCRKKACNQTNITFFLLPAEKTFNFWPFGRRIAGFAYSLSDVIYKGVKPRHYPEKKVVTLNSESSHFG